MLEEHGATVDRATTVAKLPGELIEQRPAHAAGALHARRTTRRSTTCRSTATHVYLSTDGCGVLCREADGSVRPSTKDDVARAARVAQSLDNVSATSAIVAALDCPAETRVLHELDACLRNSAKHSIVVSVKEEREARGLIGWREAIAGGSAELRRRPPFTAIICTVSPLHQERYGMDLALTLAEAGIPVSFYPMPIIGATAPVTLAGAAVVGNAEMLSATVLTQLAVSRRQGDPRRRPDGDEHELRRLRQQLARGACSCAADPGQMARFYGMPAWYGSGATTAKEPGAQSAYENALAMLMAYLCGADVTFGTGLLDGSRILCLENIVIDDEVFGMVKRILRGVAVTDETLAVDLINEMGFRGDYLFSAHTRAHVRELWTAKLGETRTLPGVARRRRPSTSRASPRSASRAVLAAEQRAIPRRSRPRARRDHRRRRGRGGQRRERISAGPTRPARDEPRQST